MTECFSARCQQDRKLVRREFNKWTKNLLFQIGLETITKNHFDFDVNVFNQTDDERIPIDFNPEQECLFCINRQEYLNNKKINNQINEHHHPITETIIDDDENAPLDLSLKSSTNNLSLITSNSRTNIKHRPLFDMKSDIPTMYGQEELDRFMSDMIASQLDFSSQSFLNMNLFPTSPTIPLHYSQTNKKSSTSLQDTRIAQLAKQMAYERMLQEIDYQRYSSTNKKSKISNNLTSSSSSSSILTESIHVNHILNDVMMRILHEMFEKQQTSSVSQPRASRKGELLFVKKQNVNNDEQYNTNIFNHFNNNYNIKQQQQPHKHNNKVNPSSSSSSSTSSVSSTRSSSIHIKNKHKTKLNQSTNYIPKGRSNEIINNNNNNNNKVMIGTDGKQIRPKRGQYRRYESEQLAKAVAAVLSNEMSVHKAGSFFGVPHSTLEYKVKERNIKASSTTKSKNESTSSISINDNDNNNNNIHHGENNDDDDDDNKSSKELTTCLPPSNSSTNNDHQDTIDDENESNDDDDNDLEE